MFFFAYSGGDGDTIEEESLQLTPGMIEVQFDTLPSSNRQLTITDEKQSIRYSKLLK